LLGIKKPSDVTKEYCCALMVEYTVLDCAQIFTLIKRYSDVNHKQRLHIANAICREYYGQEIDFEGRPHYIRHKSIKIGSRFKQQIMCFWVLMDYLDRADKHYSSGTPSSLISMEIDGRDYSILYAAHGKEQMCSYSMEKGGVTRYFVIVEDVSQIPLIKGSQIHAFVTIDERKKIKYYSVPKEEKTNV